MWEVLLRARDRYVRDQRGNVAIIFAFSLVPVIAFGGGMVDLTRFNRHKAQTLNAMDAAAIALVRRGAEDDADADEFVNGFIDAMLPRDRDPMLHLAAFDATEIDGGYRITSGGVMDTAFMPVVGVPEMPLNLATEVMMSSGEYEIALALDNTGSMREFGRIGALRDAAGGLVDDLYKEAGSEDRVKMALVPFVTAVNIKGEAFDPAWIEPTTRYDPLGGKLAKPTDRLKLFADMRVPWKGCVEARRVDGEKDTAPVDAASRWVPYLWSDEPDNAGYGNNYLKDASMGSNKDRLLDLAKYKVKRGTTVADTTSKGPNAACPRPVVELTNDKQRMLDEIGLMKPHNAAGGNNSGTNVAEGLAWAWRALSPEAPFTEGAPYGEKGNTKVLVLLSDGRNQIVANDDLTASDYTSHGYLAEGRMGSKKNYLVAEKAVDAKVAQVCENIKDQGIRLYTILFQVDYESTQEIFRACASKDGDGKPLYYYVPEASQLEAAFADIGKDLTSVRLAR